MSFDVLQDQIKAKKNPTAAILGAGPDDIPPHILNKHTAQYGETLEAAAEAALEFHLGLIDALADIVPAVELSCARFEALGWRGMRALETVIAYAKEKGLFVIADGKRADLGGSAAAYSAAWLGETRVGETACPVFNADCVTLSGYMGSDAVNPFLKDCAQRNKCAFVLARTPNPSSREFQDLVSGDRQVYTAMGDLIQRWGRDTAGKYGYQILGAVVGNAQPNLLKQLRRRLDKTFFLVTGCVTQEGLSADVRWAFDELGRGAMISDSRSILRAWKKAGGDGTDYQDAARDAAEQVRDELRRLITIF
ncbi:MAG: orotidine-5'-phosphate decarboxylase [Clostridiales bacterium]|nr:orotidine-5'-phosphate decarboxylase [Clostridiales bacterium]